MSEVDVRSSWCSADGYEARIRGWRLHQDGEHRVWADIWSGFDGTINNKKAFQTVLEGAMVGDKISYKALRLIVKTNSAYKQYKKTVTQIYKAHHRAKKLSAQE